MRTGKAYGWYLGISFDGCFDVSMSILNDNAPPMRWAEYDPLSRGDKISASSRDFCMLEITSSMVVVSIREKKMEGALISAKRQSAHLGRRATVCMGDTVMDVGFYPTRDFSPYVQSQDRLPTEDWLNIVLGNSMQREQYTGKTTYMLVGDELKERGCWERVGLLEVLGAS